MPDNKTIETIAMQMQVLHEDVKDMQSVLKELTTAITKLAIVEERQAQIAQSMERAFKAIEKVEGRLTTLEQQAPMNKQTNAWADRLVIGIITVVFLFAAHKIGLIN